MTPARDLLPAPPAGLPDPVFSDPGQALDRTALAALAGAIAARLDAAGLAGARFCLPLSSTLGSLAALLAVLQTGGSAALLPRADMAAAETGQTPWPDLAPAFCEAVLLPPDAAPSADSLRIIPLPGGPRPRHEDRVFLRTSGTTGTPKWVSHTAASLLDNARAVVARMGLSPADRVMIPVPIHHMFGLGAGLLPALLAGATIHLVPRGNPLDFFQAQRGFAPTAIFMVPSQCRSVLTLGRKAGRARVVVVAGDRLSPDEAAAFETDHGTLVALYGSTELGAITASAPDDPAALRHATAGYPLDGMTLALDPEEPAPEAEGARPMKVRAAYGLEGYVTPATGSLHEPAPAIWTTGDLIRLHPGDRIEVMGRSDHAVNRDGLLVHMGQIESCLTRHAGVVQAAVVTAGTTRRGAGLTAFCALARPGLTDPDAILAHARTELPARAVPDHVVILSALPMLASGKVDRRALAAEATRRQADPA
jgi:acyl-coenzyme A synthetase/AMP-(fatty) acid ligase